LENRIKNFFIKLFFRTVRFIAYRHDLPASQFRKGMEFFTSFLVKPRGMQYEKFKIGAMESEWFTPKEISNSNVILYLHGGGYGMGSINSHRTIASGIAKKLKSKLLIINYRLAPEHVFPAPVEDAYVAYSYLLEKEYQPSQIVVMGDSAGGGLTVALLLKIKAEGLTQPLCGVCMSPWIDLEASHHLAPGKSEADPFIDLKSIEIWGKRYAGFDLKNPLAAPVYADLTGLCPLLIQVGTDEVLYYDSITLADHCVRDKVPYELQIYKNMIHVFQVFVGFLPEADKAIKNIAIFVRNQSELINSGTQVNDVNSKRI
jgi:acetyl esterase/lipase